MYAILKPSLLFSFFFFLYSLAPLFGIEHEPGGSDTSPNSRFGIHESNAEPTEETLSDLKQLIAVVDNSSGRLYWIREDAEYQESRERLREKLESFGTLEQLLKSFEKIEFPVWSEKEKKYEPEVLDAGLLVLLATSEAATNNGRVSSVKENADRVGKLRFPFKLKDSLPKANEVLQEFLKASQENKLSYRLIKSKQTQRPDDFSLESSGESKALKRVSNEKVSNAWDLEDSFQKIKTNPAYAAWIHEKISNHEKVDEIFQSPELNAFIKEHPVRSELEDTLKNDLKAKVLLDAVPKEQIAKLLSLTKEGQGKIQVSPSDSEEAKRIRAKLLSSNDSWKLFELIKSNSQESIHLGVVNTWNWNRIENTEIKGLGALLAIALSVPEKGMGGRQLLVQDANQKLIAIPVVPKVPTTLSQTEIILEKYFEDEKVSKEISQLVTKRDSRPVDFYHLWKSDKEQYERVSNKVATNDWDAEQDVQEIIAHSNLKPEMLERFLEWRAKPQSGLKADGIVRSEKIKERLALDVENKELLPLVEQKLEKFVEMKWEELKDASKDENVRVEKPNLGVNISVVPPKDPNVPRIAVLYPSGDIYGHWLNASNTAGATAYTVYNTEQARLKIIEEYKKAGKPIDVIFGSHGHDSYMAHLLGSQEPETLKLLKETSGMIRNVYLMGCHVGRGADTNGNHLLRKFVGHGADSALGVDTYLYGGGNTNGRNEFYIIEWNGHLMTAKPNYQNHPWAQKAAVGQ